MDTAGENTTSAARLRIDELSVAEAFAHPVAQIETLETAISWVVLTGSLAYKIKKPVRFDFIDASRLERRLHYCREELRLNRRLAPDLYVGVVPITRINGRAHVGVGVGPVIDYAVCMKQFPASQELARLLRDGDVTVREIEKLAELLAHFHLQQPPVAGNSVENTEHLYEAVFGNLDLLLAYAQETVPLPGLRRLLQWTHEAARALEPCFESREQAGWVRECHGDLHAANIVRYQHRLVPFDCIEFDPRLRWIDVMNDLAFLVMDLVSYAREDLAAALLSRYLEITGDYDGVRVLPFCAVYRALVRAKVDAIAVEQSPSLQVDLRNRLQRRVQTAIHWIARPPPALLLMHGPSGSGKSWLSERLVAELPALRIRSDVERKRLAGVDATNTAAAAHNQGIYRPQMSHRTYARLLECSEICLQAGFSAIIDAAFLDRADRQLFRGLAARMRAPLLIVSCSADASTLQARIDARARQRHDPSDADHHVLQAQLRDFEPLAEDDRRDAITVDTRDDGSLGRVIAAVRARS